MRYCVPASSVRAVAPSPVGQHGPARREGQGGSHRIRGKWFQERKAALETNSLQLETLTSSGEGAGGWAWPQGFWAGDQKGCGAILKSEVQKGGGIPGKARRLGALDEVPTGRAASQRRVASQRLWDEDFIFSD